MRLRKERLADAGRPNGFVRRRRQRRVLLALTAALFVALLAVPRGATDGPRAIALAEAEVPSCRFGRPCPDPGPEGWTARLEALIEERSPGLPEQTRRRVARAVVEESRLARLDPLLAAAIIDVESRFDAGALSGRGARGLMQLRPSTMALEAARHGMAAGDPHDPVTNVRLGIRYFRRLLDTFGREDRALMAYNAGPNRIGGHLQRGGIPERFWVYPDRVFAEHRRLRRVFGIERAPVVADASAPASVH